MTELDYKKVNAKINVKTRIWTLGLHLDGFTAAV